MTYVRTFYPLPLAKFLLLFSAGNVNSFIPCISATMYRPRAEDSSAGLDTVDSALESLQFSYLDGIPFVLDPRLSSTLSAVEDHLAKAKSLLNAQPKQPAVPIPDLEHFGKLEAQVLEQLEQMETDRKESERKRQEMIDKYQKEKEERLKAEEEAKQRKAEEELEKEKSR